MHKKRASEEPMTDRSLNVKRKKGLVIGALKINKHSLNPTSKSEKNSPASTRPYKPRDYSTSRNCIIRIPSPKSLSNHSEKVSPRNVKLLKLHNTSKLKKSIQESSGLLIRQSPGRASPKISFIKRKKSSSEISECSKSNPIMRSKNLFMKEKEQLIEAITKSFKETLAEPQTTLKFYSIIKLLGQGAFGKVMLGIHILSGKKVAIKVLDRAYLLNEHSRRKIFREVYILKKIRSKFVVKILEVFESEDHFLIVMEYIGGGDLLTYLKNNGRMSESVCKKIYYEIIQGANTIHKHGILHRDFKLDNILLDKAVKTIKICDFGVSKIMHKGEIILDQCGTPAYLAPEIVIDKGYEGFWSDIWSLGVLLYCMVCGTVPFKGNTLAELHKSILLGKYDLPEFLSEEVKDLMRKMLQIVPCKRIPIEAILNHPWFYDCENLTVEDFAIEEETLRLDQEAVRDIEQFGYPRPFILNSLEYKSLNHAYASYHIIISK